MLELRVLQYTDINMEDEGLFVKLESLSKMNSHLFKNIGEKIISIFNFKEHLDRLIVDGRYVEVTKALKYSKDFEKNFDRLKEEFVPVPLGFNGNLIGISAVVHKYLLSYVEVYESHMDKINKDLSEFINDKDARTQVLVNYDNGKLKKSLADMDEQIHKELNKYKSPVSSIGELYLGKNGYKTVIENIRPGMKKINSRKMKEYLEIMKAVNIKLQAIEDMVEVEKDVISKKALSKVIEEIELAANMTTLMGKYALVSYELANVVLSTEKVINEIK